MCGIFGVFSKKEIDKKKAQESFATIQHRGKDNVGKNISSNRILYHCLHAIIGNVSQPFTSSPSITSPLSIISSPSLFMTNCEIYNWQELNKKYNLFSRNDAETFFFLMEKKGFGAVEEAVNELDGVFSFFYQKGDDVCLGKDIIGEKPLYYVFNDDVFAFASEAKALQQYGKAEHLLPTEILHYNARLHTMHISHRKFFSLPPISSASKEILLKDLEEKLLTSIKKRTAGLDKVGILFSGGIDSTLLAFLCKKLGTKLTCYTAAFADGNTREAPDLLSAQQVSKQLGFSLKTIVCNLKETEAALKDVVRTIETTDVVKVGVALPFYFAARAAAKDGQKVLLSGLGSEELFAGYQRHLDVFKNKDDVNAECLRGLSLLWERDLYRDDLVTMAHTIELRLPFLDYELIRFALSIPARYKIDALQNKKILRELALRLGIPEVIASRKKAAAQYGSNFDKALEKLAKKAGCKSKKEYLG